MCKFMHMIATVSIAEGRANLSNLIKRVKKTGGQIVFTNHGQLEAVLSAYRPAGKRWRVETPDNPKRYGDLQSPVLEEWK
jgi:prevent-host-death family protein